MPLCHAQIIWRFLPDKIRRMMSHLVARGLLEWSDILEVITRRLAEAPSS